VSYQKTGEEEQYRRKRKKKKGEKRRGGERKEKGQVFIAIISPLSFWKRPGRPFFVYSPESVRVGGREGGKGGRRARPLPIFPFPLIFSFLQQTNAGDREWFWERGGKKKKKKRHETNTEVDHFQSFRFFFPTKAISTS